MAELISLGLGHGWGVGTDKVWGGKTNLVGAFLRGGTLLG